MPGTFTPEQMFTHELNPSKGWPSPYAVDKTGLLATDAEDVSGDTALYTFSGRVMHIDPTTGALFLGCPYTVGDAFAPMPLFAFPNGSDFDVRSDVGNISGGNAVTLVAIGGYELESTEFLGAGFTPNTPLRVEAAGGADKGKLLATTLATAPGGDEDLVVGIVSDLSQPLTNEFGKEFIRFWPVYLPRGL